MAVLSNTGILAGASAVDSGYKVEKSLRFEEADSSKLSRTFAQAGDQGKFTLSFWFKNCDAGASKSKMLFCLDNGGSSQLELYDGYISTQFYDTTGSGWYVNANTSTTHRFRDPAAWYHIVLSIDTNAGTTNADRHKIYINGEQLTLTFSTAWGGLMTGKVKGWNTADEHFIGMRGSSYGGNWLAAEYYFIDGQALSASDFGETDDNGKWIPKEYTGTYGPEGDYSVEWSGTNNATTGTVRTQTGDYHLNNHADYDAESLFNGSLAQPSVFAENAGQWLEWTPANGQGGADGTAENYTFTDKVEVYCTTAASQVFTFKDSDDNTTDTTISSTGWTTIKTGGGVLKSIKSQGAVGDYSYWAAIRIDGKELKDKSLHADNSFYLKFNGTDLGEDSSGNDNDWTVTNLETRTGDPLYGYVPPGSGTEPYWIDIKPASSDLSYGTEHLQGVLNGTESSGYIYNTGLLATGSGGTCFEQILFDLRDEGTITSLRTHYYCYGTSYDPMHQVLLDADKQEISGSEDDLTGSAASGGSEWFDFNGYNFSTGTQPRYIKIYYKDGDYTANGRQQLNIIEVNGTKLNNTKYANTDQNSTPNAEGDESTDTPTDFDDGGNGTGNYATINPLGGYGNHTLTRGNLEITTGTSSYEVSRSTIATPLSGKWYAEMKVTVNGTSSHEVGLISSESVFKNGESLSTINLPNGSNTAVYYYALNGTTKTCGTSGFTGATWGLDDVIGIAYNADDQEIKFYKNGVLQGTNSSVPRHPYVFAVSEYGYGANKYLWNFGQRPFAYTPPSGHKALNTYNLPEPSIKDPSKYFDVTTWDGDGVSETVTGLNFEPDLVWVKNLTGGTHTHVLSDSVRGATKQLFSNLTEAEGSQTDQITAFTSDGYTLGANASGTGSVNINGSTYVGWNWDAGTANTTVNAGSISADLEDYSKVWSDESITSTGSVWSEPTAAAQLDAEFIFDGNTTTYVGPYSSGTLTVPFGQTFSGTKTFSVLWQPWVSGETIEDQDGNTLYTSTGAASLAWVEFSGTDVSGLKFTAGSSGNASRVGGIKVAGKWLLDEINTDQTWSTYGSFSGSWSGNYDWQGVFSDITVYNGDGSLYPTAATTWTLTSSIACSSEVKFYTYGATTVVINEGAGDETTISSSGTAYHFKSGSFSGDIDTIKVSTTGVYFVRLYIDGKALIDTGLGTSQETKPAPAHTTTYRANPDAGFSIVKWSGASGAYVKIAHGLNVAPNLILIKDRDNAYDWIVPTWEVDGSSDYLVLNKTDSGSPFGVGESTSQLFEPSQSTDSDYIAYCWSEVEGYSRFGSYQGTAVSGQEAFIHCGFRPAWVMVKNANTAEDWMIWDNKRNGYNPTYQYLEANDTDAENTTTNDGAIDIVSNGFKIKVQYSPNNNNPYIFAAFAESPFKYANAR